MVGFARPRPSLQDVSIPNIGTINDTDVPADQSGLMMVSEPARCHASQCRCVRLGGPSELFLVLDPHGERFESPW